MPKPIKQMSPENVARLEQIEDEIQAAILPYAGTVEDIALTLGAFVRITRRLLAPAPGDVRELMLLNMLQGLTKDDTSDARRIVLAKRGIN